MPSLTRDEARARASLVQVLSYGSSSTSTAGPRTFESTSTIRFTVP